MKFESIVVIAASLAVLLGLSGKIHIKEFKVGPLGILSRVFLTLSGIGLIVFMLNTQYEIEIIQKFKLCVLNNSCDSASAENEGNPIGVQNNGELFAVGLFNKQSLSPEDEAKKDTLFSEALYAYRNNFNGGKIKEAWPFISSYYIRNLSNKNNAQAYDIFLKDYNARKPFITKIKISKNSLVATLYITYNNGSTESAIYKFVRSSGNEVYKGWNVSEVKSTQLNSQIVQGTLSKRQTAIPKAELVNEKPLQPIEKHRPKQRKAPKNIDSQVFVKRSKNEVGSFYSIQILTSGYLNKAKGISKDWQKNKNIPSFVEKKQGGLFRIYIGKYKSKNIASLELSKLKNKYNSSLEGIDNRFIYKIVGLKTQFNSISNR